MHFVVKKIAKIVVGAVGLAVLGLSTITAQPAKAADSGASTDNSVVTVADKNLSSDTIFPNFMYGRGITTTHQSDQNYNGRMYATGEHYVSGTQPLLFLRVLIMVALGIKLEMSKIPNMAGG
ncbi:hypothetical protein [Lentilactobacillus kisonensis]|uniref:hypothetical protein n=1 Tax=Lentilactobacillus kisonensis TaxID=481722 RepID=UPI0006D01CDB|nr:hypothetical protein [Lentilactobacillus kisonensis]